MRAPRVHLPLFLIFKFKRSTFLDWNTFKNQLKWKSIDLDPKSMWLGGGREREIACWRIFYHFPAGGKVLHLTSYSFLGNTWLVYKRVLHNIDYNFEAQTPPITND